MTEPLKVALVGIGEIAHSRHDPSIAASPDWELAATVSRHGQIEGIEAFRDMSAMLEARPDIPVVSLCLPPLPRYDYAVAAIRAGRHVMLEKPPGATLSEVHALERLAREAGVTLYTTWHSRMAKGVAAAKHWLVGKDIMRAQITWREDVRKWHPGQGWIFEPGGMGVFDPGINALSILTEILPKPVFVRSAELFFPENRATPIAASLSFLDNVTAEFDWRHDGDDIWDIEIETPDGRMALRLGGNTLEIDGVVQGEPTGIEGEYPALYARMAALVRAGDSEIDLTPMRHVADAMTLGRRITTVPFDF